MRFTFRVAGQRYVLGCFCLFLFASVVSGCLSNQSEKSSVLVIAVDSLGVEDVPCSENYGEPSSKSGFATLCQDSVRFTHAYTPSSLAQPTLASLLTARYPHEHGVWHNGEQFLTARIETASESASQQGYHTSMFSGGPPIWSKSGLRQGFELFEDHIRIGTNLFYRPFHESTRMFLNWIDREVRGEPFFSVVYVPDLQFENFATQSDLGEIRDRSFKSQLAELDESLSYLFRNLKKRHIWHSTNVILVGLNGRANSIRLNELKSFNLYSEGTKVALLIKPTHKKRDLGLRWKVDRNVSLVDVGATLYELVGVKAPHIPDRFFQVVSLKKVIEEMEYEWEEPRMILLESAWPQWRASTGSRFAIRKGSHLLLFDTDMKIFNTLTDRQESTPLSMSDEKVKKQVDEIGQYLEEKGFIRWNALAGSFLTKVRLGQIIHGSSDTSDHFSSIKKLLKSRQWDRQLVDWWAKLALSNKNWKELLSASAYEKNQIWRYIAERNLGKEGRLPNFGCIYLLKDLEEKSRITTDPKKCSDSVFLALLRWKMAKQGSSEKAVYQAKFFRLYRILLIDRRLAEENLRLGSVWDIYEPRSNGPSLTDLVLSLPRFSWYQKQVEKRFVVKKQAF